MTSGPDALSDTHRSAGDLEAVWTLFAVAWAGAVVFHFAGNPRLAPEWGRGLAVALALAVLVLPRRPWIAVPLAAAVIVDVWLEAPALGNHWLLHGFLALLVVAAVVAGRGRPAAVVVRLLPPARLLLLAFYSFAAFAKLNRDFFDPAVSCAVFYVRESAGSWHLLGAYDRLPSSVDMVVAVAVAAIELSVPLLLVVRRTRHVGVAVAIGFHWILAVDRTHQFFDFSSLLTVFFLLFLDVPSAASLVRKGQRAAAWVERRWASGPELARLAALAAVAVAGIAIAGPDDWATVRPLREIGVAVWMILGVVVFGLVVATIREQARAHQPLVGDGSSRWLLLVPALAVLNGLTPYLEVKSGFGWNMYSNLAVVDGASNHYVVRSGFPVSSVHERLVEIVETDDPALDFYDGGWRVPERQLLDYLAHRDGIEVVGEVDGERVVYEGGRGGARPTWQQKFQLFRAVDVDGPTDCQPSFGPAR